MTRTCPSDDVFSDMLADRLAPQIEAVLEDHLAVCRRCRERLDHITGWQHETDSAGEETGDTSLPLRMVASVAARLARVVPVDAVGRPRARSSGLPSVPGYEILGEIGRGGCGVVYRAVDRALARTVALKLLRDRAGADALERFRREAAALAQLRHPNVVQIYGVGDAGEQPFLALEYVAGGSLARFTAGQPQDPTAAAEIIEALARGVGAANRSGLVHRDLKPANILLEPRLGCPESPDLSDFVPKVTDFGVVKSLEADPGLTDTRDFLGTPSYMAPEQAGGRRPVDHRADVYALGAILYELLTGHPPFRAATPIDTLVQVAFDEPIPPSRLQPRLPRDLQKVCLKCLEKDPAQRYATAEALADDLARFREGRPVHARSIQWPVRAWRWCRRSPRRAALAALAASFVLALAVGGPIVAQREYALRERATTQEAAALAEKERARKHLDLASRALDETINGLVVNARLRAYGMDDARADLLRGAVPYLQAFAEQEEGAPDIQVRQGRAAIQMATVNVRDGRLDQAVEAYSRGIALFDRLASGPDRARYATDLATAHMEYGRFLFMFGNDFSGAERHLRKALREQDCIAPDEGGTNVQLDNKACTLALLAALPAARRVDQEEHRAFLERALRMREQLAADNPKRPDLRRYASMVAMNLALLLNEMGYKQEAADQLTQALANESRLTGTAAASLDGPRLRSDMEGTLGEILFKLGRLGEGLSHVRTALQITETAALLFPADADFAAKAMLWRDSLANIHEAALDPDRATAVRREAVAFANTVIAAAPTVHAHLDGLLAAHLTLAENLAGRGQAEAAAEFTAAIVVGRRLTTMVSPPDPSARRAECFRRLAMHDLSTDRPGDALGWLNLAVALIEGDPLWSDGPFRRDIETRRAQSLDCLGRPDEAAAARTRADKCLRQSSPAARTQGTTAKRSSVSGQ